MAQRTNSTTWNVGDNITAARQQDFNQDIDVLFEIGCSENITTSYNSITSQLTTLTDVENGVVYTFDWSMFTDATTPYFEVTDDTAATNTWRFSYNATSTFFTGVTLQP